MSADTLFSILYLVPFVLIFYIYLRRKKHKDQRNLATHIENVKAGLTEPASLHPVINVNRCIGAAACVKACPEGDVIGIIHGKAELINPTRCIGHGACLAACPVDAITLVFGTEKRGLDIPMVKPNFETNIPGLFIAGELGGMGLIRNAITQGRQAMEAIVKQSGKNRDNLLDVVIVGAGPAGIAATLGAMQSKLKHVTIEQDSFGGTVSHFPRGKIVMTQPAELPIIGMVKLHETTKEALLELWQDVAQKTGMEITYHERLEDVRQIDGGFEVETVKMVPVEGSAEIKATRHVYKTRTVLLTIGRRGTPRKLGVPGEDQPKVVYRLIDPEQYKGQHVLVVGGGDSALEAATSIAEQPGSTVSLSYRSAAFSRAKEKNRKKVADSEAAGRLNVYLKSTVKDVGVKDIRLDHDGKEIEFPNDAVIVCAGGILPTPFLKKIGIEVETKHGTP